jgi:hypothetical protein
VAVRATDRIMAPARGSAAEFKAWGRRVNVARLPEFERFADELWAVGSAHGMDPMIPAGGYNVETAQGNTMSGGPWAGGEAWERNLNPGSIGVVGFEGGADFDLGMRWPDGRAAARAYLAHLYAYATGLRAPWQFDNVRVSYVLADPERAGRAPRLVDLGSGMYADDDEYGQTVAARANAMFAVADQEDPMASITFGRVPKPDIIPMLVAKPRDGAGFNYVALRTVYGTCEHITDGEASLEWYASFFGIGGERELNALTDYGIDKAGRIAMWNDPFGNRSPWASGGSDGLEGDGPALVRRLGIDAINGGLGSKEHIAKGGQQPTDAQFDASARLNAWLADGASNHPRGRKIAWSDYPYDPSLGIVINLGHYEFATKGCPLWTKATWDRLQDLTRGYMKKYQEGDTKPPVEEPPVQVPPVDHDKLPGNITLKQAEERFGQGKLTRPGKKTTQFKFHLGRAWAEAWLERAAKENVWPAATIWQQVATDIDSAVDVISFVNGWVLMRFTDRGGWRWL